MSSINTVSLVGRAGRDPEIRYFESGTAVASFALAVDGWNRDAGEKNTHWIDLKIWGKVAQVAADYVRKGSMLAISGRIEQERWTTKQGDNRSKLVVVVNQLQLLSQRSDAQQPAQDEEPPF